MKKTGSFVWLLFWTAGLIAAAVAVFWLQGVAGRFVPFEWYRVLSITGAVLAVLAFIAWFAVRVPPLDLDLTIWRRVAVTAIAIGLLMLLVFGTDIHCTGIRGIRRVYECVATQVQEFSRLVASFNSGTLLTSSRLSRQTATTR